MPFLTSNSLSSLTITCLVSTVSLYFQYKPIKHKSLYIPLKIFFSNGTVIRLQVCFTKPLIFRSDRLKKAKTCFTGSIMETVNPFFADSRPLICAVFPLAFGFYKAIIAPIAKPGFSFWIMRQIGTECQCASIDSFIVKKLSWERHRGFQRMLSNNLRLSSSPAPLSYMAQLIGTIAMAMPLGSKQLRACSTNSSSSIPLPSLNGGFNRAIVGLNDLTSSVDLKQSS